MSFSITLYKNSSKPNRVDKTEYLEEIGVLSGNLRDETSIINMSITVELDDVPNFNYVYIEKFNRYYFVLDFISIRSNLWELHLSVDVLMSHKNELLNCIAFIDRNEKYNSPLIIDQERVIREGFNYTEVPIYGLGLPPINYADSLYEESAYCFVLNGYKLGLRERE